MDSIEAAPATALGARTEIDVAAERARTVGAGLSHHFNAAGSALPSHGVMTAVVDHLRLEERYGGYEAAAVARERTEDVYAAAAELIGARAHEIALFDSASTGLRVIVDALRPGKGERIVASSTTYVSHAMHLMTVAREHEAELVVAPVDAQRQVDLAALDALLADGRPTIVTVSHIPTSSGLVEPAERIGEIARRHGATYVLDATQSVGHLTVDVDAIGCDALVTTGRKFLRGPRGTGFGYVRQSLLERLTPTAPDVRGAEWVSRSGWELNLTARRFESWESAVAARLGLGVGLREALERSPQTTQRWLRARGRQLRSALADVPGVTIADPGEASSAIVTFVVDGVECRTVVERLAARNVRVVSVPATHGQWDLGARSLPSVVRASVHVYNDDDDLDALVEGVRAVVAGRVSG
ncbi:aminotransferase class V-fold PLP-dependent enzyme [Jiangella anatolica]|uniref:Aminotransferase n=1 Tax=Jiangella anatolica TaxID=2670374 RepID=A0A2W2C0L1_9ACTN|nr:aminotransferase class V-fold PLP-dependent enzyme [Jiangella anatolica]PZF85638.1 aminotransferase [Jiangella anatolica]